MRGGGVIFVVGVILYYLFFGFAYSYFFAGLLLISVISFLDDIITTAPLPQYYLELIYLQQIKQKGISIFCSGRLNTKKALGPAVQPSAKDGLQPILTRLSLTWPNGQVNDKRPAPPPLKAAWQPAATAANRKAQINSLRL